MLASAEAKLPLGGQDRDDWQPVVDKQDRERWNDWGIGLLLQGDLKGAEYAFRKVTEAEPGYADGWLNVARALIQEGETDAAKPFLAKAPVDRLQPGPRPISSRPWCRKRTAIMTARLRSLRRVEQQYPRDRVVVKPDWAVFCFCERQYADAVHALYRGFSL